MVETQIQRYCRGWVPVEISRGPEISTGIDKNLFLDHFHNLICCDGMKTSPSAKAFLGPTKGHFGQFWCTGNPQMRKIPIFGRRYIRKYGSNRKSKRDFPRAKIGQRTRFRCLKVPQRESRPISGQILAHSEISKTQYFHYFVHWRACRKFYGPKIF